MKDAIDMDANANCSCQAFERPLLHGAAPQPSRRLVSHPRGSAWRRVVEKFVRDQFRLHFDANVRQFMPVLLALHDADGQPRAVVGCRAAAGERLFLETYTRQPIERVIERRLGASVRRESIVEVGSLACRSGRAAVDLVKALVPALIDAGFAWVVFTGADTVTNVFRHLALEPDVLCEADQSLLGPARDTWGTYYDHHPRVMAGRLQLGLEVLRGVRGVS